MGCRNVGVVGCLGVFLIVASDLKVFCRVMKNICMIFPRLHLEGGRDFMLEPLCAFEASPLIGARGIPD